MPELCAYCGRPAEGEYSIHRDGFGEGPEVDLCNACGASPAEVLSCEEIWARIAHVNGRAPLRLVGAPTVAEAIAPMKCWCAVSCADTYCSNAEYDSRDDDGRVTHSDYRDAAGPSGALTFVCKWCRCPTPWCCGGSGDALDDELCDRCWCERHPNIEAEIAREARELEAARG